MGFWWNVYMGVSKNKGTPKWMVYNGKPYQNGWFGGTTIFGNTHMLFKCECYDIHPKKEIMNYLLHVIKFCPTSPKGKLLWLPMIHFKLLGVSRVFVHEANVVKRERWCDFSAGNFLWQCWGIIVTSNLSQKDLETPENSVLMEEEVTG